MEGGAIAARAAAAGLPFLSVRAILDEVADELRVPEGLVDPVDGRIRRLALLRAVATHRAAVADLAARHRMQRAAQGALERFFERWLAGGG
jgi:hypothetical protein